jgi:hypothetical protein
MTTPAPGRQPSLQHWSSESLAAQALAIAEHAQHELKNQENDPQARTNCETDLRQIQAMLTELRRRYGNQRREAVR